MNAVTISGSRVGGMHRGDGGSLSGWTKKRMLALFVALVTGGIDQPVNLAVPAGNSAAGAIRD